MRSSTATLSALHSPHALSIFIERMARYLRLPAGPDAFVVSLPGARRVLVGQHGRSITVDVIARDDNDLAALMAEIESELEQSFGRVDYRNSVAISWQRQESVPVALR